MPEAWIVPAAEQELREADDGSQRALLGAIEYLQSNPRAGQPYGGVDSSPARYFIVDNWWIAYVVEPPPADRLCILQVAVPGARSRDDCFEEAVARLNGMPVDHPAAPALAAALSQLTEKVDEVIKIRTN